MRVRRRYPGLVVAGLVSWALGSAALADAAPQVTLRPTGTQRVGGQLVLLAGGRVGVHASVAGAPAGSTLVLTFARGARASKVTRHAVGSVDGSPTGVDDAIRVGSPGSMRVSARVLGPDGRDSGARPAAFVAIALQPKATKGARGLRVRFLQVHLAALHYAIAVTGRYDAATRNAVIAFRKANRMRRVYSANPAVFRLAGRGRGGVRARYPRAGRHVEADLTRQLLLLVDPGGRVFRIYHSSSGRPRFKTPVGIWRFWRKEPGLNDRLMLDSVYFTHAKKTKPTRPACAVHGYFAVPTHPNSHCCMRVPMANARFIFNWIRLGERIYVYY